MSDERLSTAEALRRRAEFEGLFGIREVYVAKKKIEKKIKKKRPARAKAADVEKPADAAKPARRAAASVAKSTDARTRRKEAVEAARRRSSEAVKARQAAKNPAAGPAEEAAPRREIVIESLAGSQNEFSLLSEAERAGIPHVSAKKGPKAERLAELAEVASACARCRLAEGRTNVVFGEGDPDAKLVFVGEAPGAEEDRTGRPFVGRAGKLLTKIIEAMGYSREDVFICNVLKSRPPGNRAPLPDEIAACSPFLHEQLAVIRPKVICALGGPASHTLLQTKEGITRLRGRFFWYRGIPLMPTFHPAYLLRNPKEKKTVWEDMKQLKAFIEGLA